VRSSIQKVQNRVDIFTTFFIIPFAAAPTLHWRIQNWIALIAHLLIAIFISARLAAKQALKIMENEKPVQS
jgi:hypothetical protein